MSAIIRTAGYRLLRASERLGQLAVATVQGVGAFAELLAASAAGAFDLAGPLGYYLRKSIVQQVYFTGVQAFGLINITGAAMGVIVVVKMQAFGISDAQTQVKLMDIALFQQLTPLLCALIVIGRSGAALTSEIGEFSFMNITDALLVMGIDPERFIVFPRLLGVTVSLLFLTFWCNICAILGAALYSFWTGNTGIDYFLGAAFFDIDPINVALTLLMVSAYGVAIVVAHARMGLASGNVIELQRNLPRAFVRSLLLCVFITTLFSLAR